MHTRFSRARRLREPTPAAARRATRRRDTREHRGCARARGPRATPAATVGLVGEADADGESMDPALTELCIQATVCLVRAAATCEPRASVQALCEAAVELVTALDPEALRAWLLDMLAPTVTTLERRAHLVVELAAVRARAARFAAMSAARQAYARGFARAPDGRGVELASRALELVLDPFVPLCEGLPRAVELAEAAAVASTEFAEFAQALTSAHHRQA